MSRFRRRTQANKSRASERTALELMHRAKHAKDWRIDGFVDQLRVQGNEMRASGWNETAITLSLWAVASRDPRLEAAVDALIELGLAGGDAWKKIGAIVGDPNNDVFARFRLVYAREMAEAGMSKRQAAEQATAMKPGGAFNGTVQGVRTKIGERRSVDEAVAEREAVAAAMKSMAKHFGTDAE